MRFLILVLFAVANSQRGLSFLRNRDSDPFADVTLDPAFLVDDPSLKGMDPPDQMIGLDSNVFLHDNVGLDQVPEPSEDFLLAGNIALDPTTEADPDLLLANDIGCDASNTDSAPIFGKVRRENSCKTPPVGQAESPNPFNIDDPFNFDQFLKKRPSPPLFQAHPEICPPKIFGPSIIPVCDTPGSTRIVQQPGSVPCKLYDVYRKSIYNPFFDSLSVAIANRSRTAIRLPFVCAERGRLWCCKEVTAQVRIFVSSQDGLEPDYLPKPVASGDREIVPENEFDKLTEVDPLSHLHGMLYTYQSSSFPLNNSSSSTFS
jgi:hypothetical protein